ncbi:MAG TPA: Rieske 2Fe-2S domain-containing protein [Streptosporangiaceae bacterium]
MSNNPSGQPGTGDSGEQSWPEYLTGGESHGTAAAGEASAQPESHAAPRRIIGTPPPAAARTLLADPGEGGGGEGGREVARELPPDPPDLTKAKRAERIVVACFLIATVAGLGFLVAYALIGVGSITDVLHSNLALGVTMSLVFLLLGIGAVIWVRQLMPDVELTEQRHVMRSDEQDRAAFKNTFEEGAEASQFVKRPMVRRSLIAATLPLAVAPIFLLRDLGPLPDKSLNFTVWRKGIRLVVYGTGRPITPAEFSSPGGIISVAPEGFQANDDVMAKAAVIIIKFRPGQLQPPTVMPWTVNDIVAYSKICTHVGCPAALYEQTTHHILCPCHQSTFDAAAGAKVLFGPATRPLPQLPIGLDAQGFLIATSDFHEPVGPSYWERS